MHPPSNVNLKVKWLRDQADRVSIFNSILTETSAIAKSDFILQSNCPSMIVNSLFNTFHGAAVVDVGAEVGGGGGGGGGGGVPADPHVLR